MEVMSYNCLSIMKISFNTQQQLQSETENKTAYTWRARSLLERALTSALGYTTSLSRGNPISNVSDQLQKGAGRPFYFASHSFCTKLFHHCAVVWRRWENCQDPVCNQFLAQDQPQTASAAHEASAALSMATQRQAKADEVEGSLSSVGENHCPAQHTISRFQSAVYITNMFFSGTGDKNKDTREAENPEQLTHT